MEMIVKQALALMDQAVRRQSADAAAKGGRTYAAAPDGIGVSGLRESKAKPLLDGRGWAPLVAGLRRLFARARDAYGVRSVDTGGQAGVDMVAALAAWGEHMDDRLHLPYPGYMEENPRLGFLMRGSGPAILRAAASADYARPAYTADCNHGRNCAIVRAARLLVAVPGMRSQAETLGQGLGRGRRVRGGTGDTAAVAAGMCRAVLLMDLSGRPLACMAPCGDGRMARMDAAMGHGPAEAALALAFAHGTPAEPAEGTMSDGGAAPPKGA